MIPLKGTEKKKKLLVVIPIVLVKQKFDVVLGWKKQKCEIRQIKVGVGDSDFCQLLGSFYPEYVFIFITELNEELESNLGFNLSDYTNYIFVVIKYFFVWECLVHMLWDEWVVWF